MQVCFHTVSRQGDRAFVKITVVLRVLQSSSFALELLISEGLEIDKGQVSFLCTCGASPNCFPFFFFAMRTAMLILYLQVYFSLTEKK